MRSVALVALVSVLSFAGWAEAQEKQEKQDKQGNTESVLALSWAEVGREAWQTVKPALVVALILLVVAQGFKWLGIKAGDAATWTDIDVRAFIAIVIIVAFSVAAIGSYSGASALKDIALAIVGFYFGSRAGESPSKQPTPEPTPSPPSSTPASRAAEPGAVPDRGGR